MYYDHAPFPRIGFSSVFQSKRCDPISAVFFPWAILYSTFCQLYSSMFDHGCLSCRNLFRRVYYSNSVSYRVGTDSRPSAFLGCCAVWQLFLVGRVSGQLDHNAMIWRRKNFGKLEPNKTSSRFRLPFMRILRSAMMALTLGALSFCLGT